MSPEDPGEIVGIVVADHSCDLVPLEFRVLQKLAGLFDPPGGKVLADGEAGTLLEDRT